MKTIIAGFLTIVFVLPISSFAQDVSQSPRAISLSPQTATRATAAGAADARVRRAVEHLGVGKKVRLRTTSGEEVRGRIKSIGDGTFGLATGQQQRAISYADVSAIERQGMNGWIKGGIITGAIIGGLTAVGTVLSSR